MDSHWTAGSGGAEFVQCRCSVYVGVNGNRPRSMLQRCLAAPVVTTVEVGPFDNTIRVFTHWHILGDSL